jgi:hypothetical protein
MATLLQKWVTMIDRTPESFAALGIAPSEFLQPQSAADILNLPGGPSSPGGSGSSSGSGAGSGNGGNGGAGWSGRGGGSDYNAVTAYRAGSVCNPSSAGPKVIPLNGTLGYLPATEPVNLLAAGPLGRPKGTGLEGYREMQPHVQAQRVAARRLRTRRPAGLSGCHCGGTCGGCGSGAPAGDPGVAGSSGVPWAALAIAAALLYALTPDSGRRG